MRIAVRWATVWLVGLVLMASPARAERFAKTYQFKTGVTLEIAAALDNGLRVDSVRFRVPEAREGANPRLGGLSKATVAVSNVGDKARRVGIAVALLDGQGGLLGVASAGSKLLPIRPDRQVEFTLVFDHVNERAAEAVSFKIALETR
jgi:hypothetical protein